MKKILCTIALCLLVFLSRQVTAAKSFVVIANIDGAITPFMTDYIKSAITSAYAQKANALVIKMDTPGGLYAATKEMVQHILSSPVPVIVYVTPKGARAASAGVFITLSAHVAAMAPATNIGAAQPVSITGSDVQGDMKQKITNDAKAWARSIAETQGRNINWAEKSVEGADSITANEAKKFKVIDFVAKDLDELLLNAHGLKVKVMSEEVELELKGAQKVVFAMSAAQKIMKFLSNPNLVYLLILFGILGVFIEFQSPGLIFPGLLGVLFLAMVFGVQVMPINWFAVLLLLGAIAFFIAEIFVVSFGLLSIGGLILFIIGSYLLFSVEGSTIFVEPLLIWILSAGFTLIILSIGFVLYGSRLKGGNANTSGMIGDTGLVKKEISPSHEGIVYFRGTTWRAKSSETIEVDEEVIIEQVDSTLLSVKKHKG